MSLSTIYRSHVTVGDLLTASVDNTVRMWDLATGRCIQVFQGHTGGITALALARDGKHLATASNDHTARSWDLVTGRCLQVFAGHTEGINCLAITPDGRRLITGSSDHTGEEIQ